MLLMAQQPLGGLAGAAVVQVDPASESLRFFILVMNRGWGKHRQWLNATAIKMIIQIKTTELWGSVAVFCLIRKLFVR